VCHSAKFCFRSYREAGRRNKIYAKPGAPIRKSLLVTDINKTGYVYLLASKEAGTTYLGVTSDLIKRIAEHKAGTYKGFTYKHDVHGLVYYQGSNAIAYPQPIALNIKSRKHA